MYFREEVELIHLALRAEKRVPAEAEKKLLLTQHLEILISLFPVNVSFREVLVLFCNIDREYIPIIFVKIYTKLHFC